MQLEIQNNSRECLAVYTVNSGMSVADFLNFYLIEPVVEGLGGVFDFPDFFREVDLRDVLSENKDLQIDVYERVKELMEHSLRVRSSNGYGGEYFAEMFGDVDGFSSFMRKDAERFLEGGFKIISLVQELNNNSSHAYSANGLPLENLLYNMRSLESFFRSDQGNLVLEKERKKISLIGIDKSVVGSVDFLAKEAYVLCKERYANFAKIRS